MQTTLRAGGLIVIIIYFLAIILHAAVYCNFKIKQTQEILFWQEQNSKSAIECDDLELCWIVHCQALHMSTLATDFYFEEMLEQI